MIRFPNATFFLSSSSSFLLAFTSIPFPNLDLRCLFQMRCFADRMIVFTLPPANIHPIPLIGILPNGSLQPLSQSNGILSDLPLPSSRAIELQFGFDLQFECVVRL